MILTGQGNSGQGSSNSSQGNDATLFERMKDFFKTGNTSNANQNQDPFADEEDPNKQQQEPKTKQLSDFESLFQPAPVDPNAKAPEVPVDPFNHLTKEALGKAAANFDFSQAVPEELVTKALSGDPAALRQTINGAVQAAFVEMMAGSNTIADKRIQFAMQHQADKLIKQRLQDHAFDQTINENPLLSNPAVKPIRDALTKSIREANPNITPKELDSKLTDYLQTYASTIVGSNQNNQQGEIPGRKQRRDPEADGYDF